MKPHNLLALLASTMLATGTAGAAYAADINVPADFPTIQQAIDNSASGDRIIVDFGVYIEALTIPHHLVFESPNGNANDVLLDGAGLGAPIATILDYTGAVVYFEGFTFMNADPGSAAISAAHGINLQNCKFLTNNDRAIETTHPVTAINCEFLVNTGSRGAAVYINTSPTHIIYFENCDFTANTSTLSGGALVIKGSNLATVTGCGFNGNATTSGTSVGGGALRITDATVEVSNSLFINNIAGSFGGAISVGGTSTVTLTNNTITANDAPEGNGDGLYVDTDATVNVFNSIILENEATNAYFNIVNEGSLLVEYSCVPLQFVGEGNVHPSDAVFECNADTPYLMVRSPCIDAGRNQDAVNAGLTTDFDGVNRFIDVPAVVDTGDGTDPLVDMGCYEHVPQGPARRFVDADAAGGGDGMSWATAYNDLQDAIDEARCGNVKRIWVAEGTYKPDRGTGDRNESFDMLTGLHFVGGFDGTETQREQRDWFANPTTLGGAIGGAGTADNSKNILFVEAGAIDAILDGFIIQKGYNEFAGGAAMWVGNLAHPTIVNCNFRLNECVGGARGAVYVGAASASFYNTRFTQNSAEANGGGLYSYNADLGVYGCLFNGNSARFGGGIMVDDLSDAEIVNSTFYANTATNQGGGLAAETSGNFTLVNSILWENSGSGGNNYAGQLAENGSVYSIDYSDIQNLDAGHAGGTGNFDLDPLFEDADGPDDIPGNGDDNLKLMCLSPCVDAGDNNAVPDDLGVDPHGDDRILNGTVDVGFDEFPGPFAEVATLTGFTIESGTLISGGVADLLDSDNSYVNTRSGFGSAITDLHQMKMVVEAMTLVGAADQIVLTVEHRNTDLPGVGRLLMWNWNTGQWDTKFTGALGDVDQVDVSVPFLASDYIDGTGRLRVMIKHNTLVPFVAYQFQSFIDQLEVLVIPDC